MILLYLFLRNFRSTLIISLAIPIAIICTFTFMYLLTSQTSNFGFGRASKLETLNSKLEPQG